MTGDLQVASKQKNSKTDERVRKRKGKQCKILSRENGCFPEIVIKNIKLNVEKVFNPYNYHLYAA